jgi:hypothetical protein
MEAMPMCTWKNRQYAKKLKQQSLGDALAVSLMLGN